MSKLFAAALVLGTLAGTTLVASAGCATQSTEGEATAETVGFDTTDAGVTRGTLVISQLYGGGGRTGATLKNDFVELFNKSQKDAKLDGLSLQLSTTATTDFSVVVPLTGTIPAGGYFLIALGTSDDTVGDDLPMPDVPSTGTSPQIGSSKDGKVALATAVAPLACGGTGSICPTSKLLDLVGFGMASTFEGTKTAPALDVTHAALRAADGCTDVDDNSKDFTSVDPPKPRSSKTTAKPCPVPPKDAGAPVDASKPPPVTDPPLGPETPYDGGYRPEAGVANASGGGDDGGCTTGGAGIGAFGVFSPLAGLALGVLFMIRRRRQES